MANEVAEIKTKNLAEVFVSNNLASLNDQEKSSYYMRVCDSVGLNPSTRPFEFVNIKGKVVLYATKGCTDQLRKIHGVSIEIVSKEVKGDVFVVEVKATDSTGRVDFDLGVVTIAGLKGDEFGNAIMRAITKAKRRVTMSICGLGVLDETEIETIPNAAKMPPVELPKLKNVGHLAKDHVLEPVGDAYEPDEAQKLHLLNDIEEIFQGFSPSDVGKWILKNYKKNVFSDLTVDELQDAIAKAKKASEKK